MSVPLCYDTTELKDLMKDTIIVLICTLPSIAFAVGAILLALNGIGGWGWFLLATILTNPALSGLSVK